MRDTQWKNALRCTRREGHSVEECTETVLDARETQWKNAPRLY